MSFPRYIIDTFGLQLYSTDYSGLAPFAIANISYKSKGVWFSTISFNENTKYRKIQRNSKI